MCTCVFVFACAFVLSACVCVCLWAGRGWLIPHSLTLHLTMAMAGVQPSPFGDSLLLLGHGLAGRHPQSGLSLGPESGSETLCLLLPSSHAGTSWSHPQPTWSPSQAVDSSQACRSRLCWVRPGSGASSTAPQTSTKEHKWRQGVGRHPLCMPRQGCKAQGTPPTQRCCCLSALCDPEQFTHPLWSTLLIYKELVLAGPRHTVVVLCTAQMHLAEKVLRAGPDAVLQAEGLCQAATSGGRDTLLFSCRMLAHQDLRSPGTRKGQLVLFLTNRPPCSGHLGWEGEWHQPL